jgi:hypothetical protein
MTRSDPTPVTTSPLAIAREPSHRLWAAALTGLLGMTGGCSSKSPADPDPELPDAAPVQDEMPDAAPEVPSKIISETEGTRTFASLEAECDSRGGYIQIQAACAGVNSCAGFSYGDWDPGVLTEHSCAGVNGCNGLSCVVLPADSGKSGMDILAAQLPETGSRSCSNCHASWSDTGPDFTKFKVWVLPGSGRTLENWKDLSAKEQARTIAFGKHGLLADGTAYSPMAPYYKLFSRAEIERVVEHIRNNATILIEQVKVADATTGSLHGVRRGRGAPR